MAYQLGVNPVKDYVLQQMAYTPGLMASLAERQQQTPGVVRSFDPTAVQAELNPRNWVKYNPELEAVTHNVGAGGLDQWSQAILENEAYKDLMSQGYIEGTKHFDTEGNRRLAASRLADVGVQDLDQVGYTADAEGNVVFYDQATGKALPGVLKGWKSKGETSFYFNVDPNTGQVYLDEHFQKDKRRSGLGKIAPGFTNPIVSGALSIGAGFLAPGLGSAIAGSLGTSAATGAALAGAGLGGLHAGITGGNVLKSAALGGLGGGLGTYLQSAPALSNITNPAVRAGLTNALTGTATGALGSALYGGDVLKGGLTGALTGGMGGAAVGALGTAPMAGQQLSPLQQLQNTALGYAGRTAGWQLASSLIGSPYNRPATPQPQNTTPVTTPRPAVSTWLPQHVQQSILGMQGAANG